MVLHTNVASPPVIKFASVLLNEKRPIIFVWPAEISGAWQGVGVRLLYAPAVPVVQVNNLELVVKLAPPALAGNTVGQLNGKSDPPRYWKLYVPLVTGLGNIVAGTVKRNTVLFHRRSAALLLVTVMFICTSFGVMEQTVVFMVICAVPV